MNKVSVIIPTYGSNTNPCRAIDSVLSQDYTNLEVIIVDDNGIGTPQQKKNQETLEKYANEPRVKYIKHDENMGGSAARNTGVSASTGDFLCFLDDDDELADCRKVSVQVERMVNDEACAGTYSSCNIYSGDKYIRFIAAKDEGRFLKSYLSGKQRIETASPIIKRECYFKLNGFDPSFRRHQDFEFFSRLLDNYSLCAVPEVSYNRYYKTDVPNKCAEVRLANMEKYVEKMMDSIKSLSQKDLKRIFNKKYSFIVFTFFKEKNFKRATQIMREKNFDVTTYVYMIAQVFVYIRSRLLYGSDF